MNRNKWMALLSVIVMFSFALSACGQAATPTVAPQPVATSAPAQPAQPTKAPEATKPPAAPASLDTLEPAVAPSRSPPRRARRSG